MSGCSAIFRRRRAADAAVRPPVPAAPALPVGASTVEAALRLDLQRRDEEIAELREKLAACEAALGDVSEQLAAAQAPKPRSARSTG